MANRHNSIKKIRCDERKRTINRIASAELKTVTRKFFALCEKKDHAQASQLSRTLFTTIDRALKKGLLKENTASRRKSSVARRLNLIKS